MTYNPTGTLTTRHNIDSQNVVFGFANTQTVHLDVATDSTLIAFMLIDISDTTLWKHTNTDHIIIRHLLIEVDPASNFLGEIKVGFLDDVDADNGDFHQIIDFDMARKSDLIIEDLVFSGGFHCQNATHFGPHITNSTLFQTTGADILGPDGSTSHPSGNGDLVMIIDGDGTNFVDVSITIIYETVGA